MNCTEEFIAKMKQKDIVINFVQAWRNDTLEESYARLDKPTRLHAYSVSKSVTSIGVGLAVQEGLLKLDDPVLKFYPEYDPATLAPNLRKMTVRDLLKMGCGSKDKMFFWNDAQRLQCKDWQDYFLRNAFPYEPGTRFEYNNFNTYMCSCIVERVAGCTLKDYMTPRFFDKLGIGNPDWLTCPMGHSAGAYGLFLSIDEMSRIGQFLLHDGCWNGEQLLDPAYLHEAEKNQYPVNAPKHGYGYFFWTNPDDESYRADGRYGQYIVVVPKSNVVVTVQALDSKKFFDDVWSELVVPFLNKS